MTDATHYRVPKEPGRWRAITLAVAIHAALFAFLWFGVRWQNETPVAVEAEVWSPQPREAAPPLPAVPKPEVKPEPKPAPQPIAKEIPKPHIVAPPVAKLPDIALEQEKKKRKQQEEKKRLEEERQAALEKKALEQRIEKDKADIAKKKIAADEARKAAAEAKAVADVKKAAAEKKRQQDAADVQLLAKIRDEEMRRITSGVAGSGDAPKAQGGRADLAYTNRLSAKIKSNTTYIVPPDLESNPAVEYTVELLPDGSVKNIKKLHPSGLPGFDEAVERAIRRSEPYPADKSGAVPSSFTFSHKPKDNQ